jgi:penicillin-binding protein 2
MPVAAKTGTAQHGGEGSDHAAYVCYAPFDDPQIAVAIYVEKGAQGGALGNIARAIFDVYFATEYENDTVKAENSLN